MAFTSSGARKSQWTPHWFAPSHEKGEPDLGVPTSAELQSLQHGDGRKGGILNSVVISSAHFVVLAAEVAGRFSAETSQF